MCHDKAVIFKIVTKILYVLHQTVKCFSSAFFLADIHHLSLSVDMNDGTNPQQGTHGCGKAADSAASFEEFQIVNTHVHSKMVDLGL